MSASQSQLSAARYGYDFVVATTQASINATMKQFLSALTEPVVTLCYCADNAGNPVPLPYDELVKKANGSDPFAVPANADPTSNSDLKNLVGARFMMGFRAQIGLPPGLAPTAIPDIVKLGADTSAVTFNLLCSQFTVVELEPGSGYAPPSWLNVSQDSGSPWIFQSKVDLRLSTTDQSAYASLPKDVQDRIRNLGGEAFSVQQLLFDLDNAALQTIPTISGIKPGTKLYTVLSQEFLGAYFTQLKADGQPLLGAAITQSTAPVSTITMTDLNLEVCPLVGGNGQPIVNPTDDQQNLATLDYLCAANGDALPPAARFAWNWIDPTEASDADGVLALNRVAFATYLKYQLQGYVASNCYRAGVRVWLSGFLDSTVHYSWSLTSNQAPTVTMPATGPVILTFHYASEADDEAGLDGDMGQMKLAPSFDLSVSVSGTTMTVVQHLVIYLRVQSLQTAGDGNVVDITLTDTYTLAVSQDGRLVANESTARNDQSKNPQTNDFLNFFTDLNDIISNIESWLRNFVATDLQDLPLSVIQDYVFPGGRTFAFKSVGFSDFADLTSHITYTDPS